MSWLQVELSILLSARDALILSVVALCCQKCVCCVDSARCVRVCGRVFLSVSIFRLCLDELSVSHVSLSRTSPINSFYTLLSSVFASTLSELLQE